MNNVIHTGNYITVVSSETFWLCEDVDLRDSGVVELPPGLRFRKSLYLCDCDLRKLPADMHVGGDLYLQGSSVTELPDDLYVVGTVYAFNTTITEAPEHINLEKRIAH